MAVLLEKDFSPSELTLFSEILWKLGSGKGQYNLRENIIADITHSTLKQKQSSILRMRMN